MNWKLIGQNVIGSSHIQSGKGCEDSLSHAVVSLNNNEEVLICCVSDGAGSAKNAGQAATLTTTKAVEILSSWVVPGAAELDEKSVLAMAEQLYDQLKSQADEQALPLSEFSCTFLGCVLYPNQSLFFQIGDGALVKNDNSGIYSTIWWPQNGEYSNTTFFLVDDENFANLQIKLINEQITEIAITTDGLQNLVLNNETLTVHQPFFNDLFKWLRMANNKEELDVLDKKLATWLGSEAINNRTDDDKTLLLATRLKNG